MAIWLWRPSQLTIPSFLANDDLRTGYHLSRWREDGPSELADPCRRLLDRDLPRASDVSELEPAERLELLAEARHLTHRAGLVAESCCGLQQRESRGYHIYKRGLRLWDGERLQALEQRSALVASLAQPQEMAWLIHPAAVSEELRARITYRRNGSAN